MSMSGSSIFMSYEGVRGESLAPSSVSSSPAGSDWIALTFCQFSGAIGHGQRSETASEFENEGAPVRIGKETDASTIQLLDRMLRGAFDRAVVIVFLRTGQDGPVEYLRLEMLNCGIVEADLDGDGEARPHERYAIRYGEISIITWSFDGGGRRTQSVAVIRNEV